MWDAGTMFSLEIPMGPVLLMVGRILAYEQRNLFYKSRFPADMQQYKQDYTASLTSDSQANILLASYGGVLSYCSKEAKEIIEGQEKIILTKRRVTLSAEASYRYRENKELNTEFLRSLCELPTEYTVTDYSNFLMEWGTHVIIAAKLGIRESVREEHSKQTIINYLQRNQSGVLTSKANVLSVLSTSLTGSISSTVISDLRNDNIAARRWTSATGSPISPAPLALTLRGMEKFITADYINSSLCPAVQGKSNIEQLQKRIMQALNDYAAVNGAKSPEAMVRSVPLVWPKGNYGLLMARAGCPAGPWSTGSRYHDTQDNRPNNGWSDGFETITASDLWKNNLRLKFCVKQIEFDENALDLPQGSYCLFKKGTCPFGFTVSDAYIDDEDFANQNDYDGTLPDGQYDRNTKYYFCCRNDGAVRKPLYLPTDRPFFLMPMGPACQTVADMTSALHWLRIDGMGKGYSKVSEKGPYYTEDKKNNLTFYFCYYARSNQTEVPSTNATIP
ncbi:uncharacterized protein LOC129597713 isoform X2 [Paramacrobiotus metropolitanus]|uniref:uncharacterized protein LOC129597713 isoform X2 n=1 Tax=Paramacrobiotus metropolitanus TaxID=2943436 RepID=UPI00244587AB|nr:uncharacterized protein LOC129597713 isoform X2 [Paramacrobiotus metropolitanus]